MKVEVIMPQMGESIVEGTVVTWLKQPGDAVKRDEDIFTISTDKVDADIPSPAEGVLHEILVDVGTTVEVGSIVAYIETDASAAASAPAASAPTKEAEAAEPSPSNGSKATGETQSIADPGGPSADAKGDGNGSAGDAATVEELRRTRSTPLVRKIAREHGVDLAQVPGTGISGRVTKKDIMAFVANMSAAPVAQPTTPSSAKGAPGTAVARAPINAPKIHIYAEDRLEPLSRMRRSIADHMVMSRAVSAHAQSIWDCDWTNLWTAYRALKPEFAGRGVRLTITAFLVEAAVKALRAVPVVNSSLDGDNIVYRGRINVGVAVAVPEGLIVPVVKHADEMNLQGIARAVNDLAERSRNKKLRPDDVEGGTFTISNPGVFGSRFGVPIINQPQVAILGVGAIKKRVVANEDDSIRVARMNTMCLSFDHRVVDGAQADEWMNAYTSAIEGYEVE